MVSWSLPSRHCFRAGAVYRRLLLLAFCLCSTHLEAQALAANNGNPVKVLPDSPEIVGTVFAGDQAMLDRQSAADPDAYRNFANRHWFPERVEFSRDGKHLLVSMCRRLDVTRCTLKRYWIDEQRWEGLADLPGRRSYTDAQYSPDGKAIVAVSWACLDLPWKAPTDRHPILPPPQPPSEPVCAMHEPNLWLLDAQGAPQRLLLPGRFITTILNTAGVDAPDQSVRTPGAVVRWPVWSPDGKRLLYWRSTGSMRRSTGLSMGFWHVYELDLAAAGKGAERRLDDGILWVWPSGVPVYGEGGKRVIASGQLAIQWQYAVVEIDLGQALPVKTPPPFFPDIPMPVRYMDDSGIGLYWATGGSGLYRADLSKDRKNDHLKSTAVSTKLWQSRGSGLINVHAAVTPDWKYMALIEGMRQPGADEFRNHILWLRFPDLSVRHIRLPE